MGPLWYIRRCKILVVELPQVLQCSFCGETEDRQELVSSPGHPGVVRGRRRVRGKHYICYECVATCNATITQVTGHRDTVPRRCRSRLASGIFVL